MKIVLLCAEDFSLGIVALSAFLKLKGHEVNILFDPKQFQKAYSQNSLLAVTFNRKDYILHEISLFQPDVIGFSVNTANYTWSKNLAREIKKISSSPIIFGGIHPTLVPESVINEDVVDMICIGEGEEPLAELLLSLKEKTPDHLIKNIWFKKDKQIIKNPIRSLKQNLDDLPFPDRDALYDQLPRSYSRYPIILTSYGCPYRCTYCANNAIAQIYKGKGKYLRRRSPDHVMREIKEIKKKYQPKYIIFMDDLFTLDINWLKEFTQAYAKEIALPYSCLTHAKYLNKEVCQLLKKSYCNIVLLGLQSGSETIRREVLKRKEQNEEYREAVKNLKEHGIKFSLDNIIDIPFETEDDLTESLHFYNELRPNLIHSFNLIYFPKTQIIQSGIDSGALKPYANDLIDRGLTDSYMSVQLNSKGNYKKFALLFTIIPLFSYNRIEKVISDTQLRQKIAKLPMIFVLLTKFILNVKVKTGFIFLNVLQNEWFYMKDTLYKKWIHRQKIKN